MIFFFFHFVYLYWSTSVQIEPVFLAGQCDSVYVKYCYVNMRIKNGMGWQADKQVYNIASSSASVPVNSYKDRCLMTV